VGNDHLDAQTSARLLKRAQAIQGGRERLAEILGVHPHDLALWTAGKAFPPQAIFDKVLEIILDAHDEAQSAAQSAGSSAPAAREKEAKRDAPAQEPVRKPRALVADSEESFAVISRILAGEVDLIPVHTVTEAVDLLQGSAMVKGRGFDVIVCGQHFEGSQMLRFLEVVKAYKPTSRTPFICCRALPTRISEGGLAAMREACEALGALAYIDLPDRERKQGVEAASVEFRAAVRAAVHLPKDAQTLRVLVADDNADAAHTLTVLLRMAGHHVQKAGSGADALRIAEEFRPSVIVLDIGMPGMSGYVVAEKIRAAAWGKSVTLIALTGRGAAEDMARAREAGFDRHFAKPVELQQLLEAFPAPLFRKPESPG
jgi:CheY-like chemotaxis protein